MGNVELLASVDDVTVQAIMAAQFGHTDAVAVGNG